MKRLLTVALTAGCFYFATTYSAFAQAQSAQPAQANEVHRTEATAQSYMLSKPKAPEMPALQQLQEQTGMFSPRNITQEVTPLKGDPTNKVALAQLAARFQNEYQAAQTSLLKKSASIPVTRMVTGNAVIQYKKVNGSDAPLFYVTSNLQGAHTSSTSKVWPGGVAGLNLTGQGVNMGEWDGGAVRTTHQEFGSRVTVMDASPNISQHATHVAATIIGAGTDPLAKGMAYQGVLKSYDWTNDEAEMATAASAGMLVSNHSYGLITGWYFGNIEGTGSQWYWFGSDAETEDQNYGRYTAQARDWDLIAANAPNYLAVKAAGNDRNGGPAAGVSHRVWNGSTWVNSTTTREKAGGNDGYDCISHAGVAKNVLTVGAVEGINGGYAAASQVIASSFHGWGPTDDGRIKPDLVAKGVAVYSATSTSNTSYEAWNGTSMASPVVTGSLALLQQYHKQLYNDAVLKAATLKGIAIHTADEAGDFPGPDYRFGWGLLNTEKATQVIARLAQKHDFKEEVLANGAVNNYAIRSDGASPLRVTLSWTDVAAAIAPSVLNGNTSALVNNLDVRLIRVSDSAVFSPWVLNPAVPAAAATFGDNNRDNVEQVFLANPGAGDYIVRVSHKGTLGASQAFSLVMSGIVPLNVMRNITFRVDMTGLSVSNAGVRIAGNVFNPAWDPSANLMTNVGNGIWTFTTSILSGTNVQYKFINGNAWGQDENALPSGCNTGGNRTYTVPNNDDVLPAFLFNQCNAGGGQMVSVTFNVNMAGQTIRPEGVHVAGNFQGWNPGGTPMTLHPTLPNVYTYTTQILEGTEVEYKYINGNSWGFFDTTSNQFVNYSEQTPFACTRFTNRFFTVPSSAITLPVFLFGRCNTAAQTPLLVDFAGGIPAGWVQQGFSGTAITPNANAVFEYRGPSTSPSADTGSRGGYSGLRLPIMSPTAANGFLIFDSDFLDNGGVVGAFGTGTAPSPHLARLTSPTLNLSNVSAPVLRFNQFYRKFGSAPGYTTATFVVASTDGGVTWPDTIQFNTGNVLAQNIATLRDNQQQLFLPSLGGQANVKIQFLFWGDYYFWMLDDIVLEQSFSNDLAILDASIFNSNTGLVNTYGMVPLSQQQPATFAAVIQNLGATAVTQPGVEVNVFRDSINVYTEAGFSNNNLGFGATASINITNPSFVANQTGTYRANFSLLNNTGDSNPSNNQLDRHFFITDTVYALDHGPFGNYVTVGTNNFVANGSRDGMRFANRFSVIGTGMQVSSAFLGVASTSTPGASVTFGLVNAADITNPTAAPVAITNSVVLTAQHIAAGGVSISFPGGHYLAPGEYYLVAETFTNSGASVVNVLDDISRPRAGDASMIYLPTPALWYSNGIAFVLRMHGTSPASLPNSLATFRVNMSKYPVDTTVGVHVAGNFQGWQPNASPLTHIGNGIYEATYPVQQGSVVQFKFINGNSWGRDEQNWLMDCGVDNLLGSYDRVFRMPFGDTILPAFFFNSCGSTLNELSIADIQYVPDYLSFDSLPNRQSRYKGDTVTVKGVVAGSMTNSALSANFKNGYLQMMLPQQSTGTPLRPSAHTGVNVRLTNLAALADTVNFVAGSYVSITGVVAEFSNTNFANSETQIDIASTGKISVLSLNAPPVRSDIASIGDFSFTSNNLPVQNAFGERFEGSYMRFEEVEVVAINQFAAGRFDLTLKDQNNNTIRTRDASRVLRAPYFSDTDSTALIFVRVGDKINIQGFMSELVTTAVPAYRINPWHINDIEIVPVSTGYCASGANDPYDTKIDSVVLGGGFATGSHPDSCEAYTNYTGLGMAASLEKGVDFPISIKIGTCNAFYPAKGRVFVDLNQDFNFTPDEALYNFELDTTAGPGNPWYHGTIQVPATALTGPTRMRIVYKEGAVNFADVNSCGPYNWGETEDYTIQIVPNSGAGAIFTDVVRSRGTTTAVVAGGIAQVANIASKGVVYSTSPMPTLATSSVIDFVAGNRVVTNLNNLLPNTQYFARVFVTDSAGATTYANEINFRTFDVPGSQLFSPIFAVTEPTVVAGSYAYGIGQGTSNLWNYIIDTLSVRAPMVIGRAVQSDSLGCGGSFTNANEVRGKIAVLYRGSCDFGLKALSAQNAGAVGVVIINNQPGIINLSGGANGANVTIPVYLMTAADGALLRQYIDQGTARAIMGNKAGTFALDVALESGDLIKPRAVAIPNELVNQPGDQVLQLGSFVRNLGATPVNYMLSIQVWQYGAQNNIVFSQNATSTMPLAAGAMAKLMLPAMPGFNLSTLGIGRHKIRYEVIPTTGMDASNGDNVFFQDLDITQDVYSATRLDSGGNLIITGANRPAVQGAYTVGNWFSANTAGRTQVNQLKFAFNATAPADLTGQFIEGSVYKWDDLNANSAIDTGEMLLVGTGNYTYPDNGVFQTRTMTVSSTSNPNAGVQLINGARYLFAVSYSGSAFEVYACTDGVSNYTATADHTGFPVSAVLAANGIWSTNGFGPATVFAIAAVMSPAQQQAFGTVTGQVRYASAAQTPMSNTVVVAYNASDFTYRADASTDANGNFVFNNAPAGNYVLRAATTKPWGGVNATDALRVARHFTSLQPLSGIRREAADVNANEVVNSTDALQIAQRFTGLLNNPTYLRIYFDALLGGALAQSSGVHMHSGASIDPNFAWQYVVGNWGIPTSPGGMTSLGNGRWGIAINPITYYNQAPNGPMPASSTIESIGMVLRESGPCTSCLEQKDGLNGDIFLYPSFNPPVSTYLGVKAAQSNPNGFAAGDWLFSEETITVTANQTTTVNIQGVCVGDVDGSFNPSNVRVAPKVALGNDGELELTTGRLVKLPIRIETGAHLGAISLVMAYDRTQIMPISLKLANANLTPQVNITNEQIHLSWFDLSGWVVTNGEVIMELEAYVTTPDLSSLNFAVGEGSEFADVQAQPILNTRLLLPGIASQESLASSNVLSLMNYPNPFTTGTTIGFDLPEQADVKLVINDMSGRTVARMDLGELASGKHAQLFDAIRLQAGVYFCELHAAGKTINQKAIIRMIVQ